MANLFSKPTQPIEKDLLRSGGVISGDAYPELRVRKADPAASAPSATPAPLPVVEDPGHLVLEGRLRELAPEACQHLLDGFLERGHLATFTQGIEQVMAGLDAAEPETRRWALETIQLIAAQEDQDLMPHGTLAMLLGAVGRCLPADPEGDTRELAVDTVALILGTLGVSGDLEGARSHLARVIHDAGPQGPTLRKQILSSKLLPMSPLRLVFREGRGAMESRVLPFFRFAGADGGRGLVRQLEEEENRQRRGRILEILKALAPQSLEPVKESLQAEAWYLVRNALNLLGELADPESFEAVSRFLEHPDLRIRRAAVRAFWKTGGLRAESYLVDLLPRSVQELQEEILLGLAQIQGKASALPIARLAAQSTELRVQAIDALTQLAEAETVPTLATFLERKGRILKTAEPAPVRLAAAKALKAIGTPAALEALALAVQAAPRNGDQEALRQILEKSIW